MKKTSRGLSALAISALALALITPTAANAAVKNISGREDCPAGQTFRVTAYANSGTIAYTIAGKIKDTKGRHSSYTTNLRSGTWKVSGTDLISASSDCVGNFGGDAGGSFRMVPSDVITD